MENKIESKRKSVQFELTENTINYSQNEILSKFLNSLPNHNDVVNDEQCFHEDQILNEKKAQLAEEKITLEKQMLELKLENTDENMPNNEQNPITDNEQFDQQSVHSYAYSTASTFSPHEVKSRLIREKKKREMRDRMKVNPKNIKGDANAIMRRKKNDQSVANEDLKAYISGTIW